MNFSTNLTNNQWELVKNEFCIGKNAKINRRTLVDAVMFIIKTGNSWRKLANFFDVNWKSVYSFFMRMKTKKVWKRVLNIIDEDIKNNPNTHNEDTKNIKKCLHLNNNQNNYGFIDKGKKKIDPETYAFLLGIDTLKTENENKIINNNDNEDTKNIKNRLQHSIKLKKKNIDIEMYTDLLEMKTEDLEKIVTNHIKYNKKKKQIDKINKTANHEDKNCRTKNIYEDKNLRKNGKINKKINAETYAFLLNIENMKTKNAYEKISDTDTINKNIEKTNKANQVNKHKDNKSNETNDTGLECTTKENCEFKLHLPLSSLSSSLPLSSFKDFLNSFKPSPSSLKTFGNFPDPKSSKMIKNIRINCQKPTDIEILNNYELIIAFLLQELHIAQTKSHQA